MVVHTSSPSTQEVKAGRTREGSKVSFSCVANSRPAWPPETLPQKTTKLRAESSTINPSTQEAGRGR